MTTPTEPQTPQPESGLTATQLAELLALVQAQAAIRQQIVDAAVAAIVNPLRILGSDVWWNDKAYRKVVTDALRIVQPAQKQAARQTDAYITRATKIMTGRSVRPAGAVDTTKLRKELTREIAQELVDGIREPGFVVIGDSHDGPGEHIDQVLPIANDTKKFVDPAEPYERVAEAYRYQVIAEGKPEVDARKRALVRLATVTETDITLAVRAQYEKSLGEVKAFGYRRILHPELAKFGHSCALCVVAADRTYHIKELKPIHDLCNCEVLPIIELNGKRMDPGITLNKNELDALYNAAGRTEDPDDPEARTTGGQPLRKVRVALAEHAELGPVLVNADHNWRGPKQVAETKADEKTRLRHQYNKLLEQHEKTRAKAAAGDKISIGAMRWQVNRIGELERALS